MNRLVQRLHSSLTTHKAVGKFIQPRYLARFSSSQSNYINGASEDTSDDVIENKWGHLSLDDMLSEVSNTDSFDAPKKNRFSPSRSDDFDFDGGHLDRHSGRGRFNRQGGRGFDRRGGRGFDRQGGRGGFDRRGGHYNNQWDNGFDSFDQRSSPFEIQEISWENEDLPPFEKNFYDPEDSMLRTDEEVEAWKQENSISISAPDSITVPKPVRSFAEAGFDEKIVGDLDSKGWEPTPIQQIGMPLAMSGHDMIGVARTGSGKTLSFVLPCIRHILAQPPMRRGDGPAALIVAPTRELANQINQEVFKYVRPMGMRTCVLYGGASKNPQAAQLMKSPEIVVATPGRLLDLIQDGATNLKRVTYLVLDEADRMLDMGFEKDLRKIFEQVRPDRQVLMWSATWPKSIKDIASTYITDAVKVQVGSNELAANADVEQKVMVLPQFEKSNKLFDICDEIVTDDSKIICFVATKSLCDRLTSDLRSEGFPAFSIHGNKSQSERDYVMESFRNGETKLLIATDVAARGIDVNDVTHVINYDMPHNIEDYVHRIGRTGRAGKKGKSISFFDQSKDSGLGGPLVKLIEGAGQELPQELEHYRYRQGHRGGHRGRGGRYGGSRHRGVRRGETQWSHNRKKKFATGSNNIPLGSRKGRSNDDFDF